MTKKLVLEICAETLLAAEAAQRAGADRVELCRELRVGGLTPSLESMREVRAAIEIPVMAMVRPRGGDFFYSQPEFEEMKREIALARSARMDGVVLGILTGAAEVDVRRTAELVELARPLPVTFHRAFDELPDLGQALEDVIRTGAKRLLLSGGAAKAEAGCAAIARIVEQSAERIAVMPGGGIRPGNLGAIALGTRAKEFHSGLSHLQLNGEFDREKFERAVRELRQALDKAAELQASHPA
jgi:copper homeostasis protein